MVSAHSSGAFIQAKGQSSDPWMVILDDQIEVRSLAMSDARGVHGAEIPAL